jgi:predicted transcriptional regulator
MGKIEVSDDLYGRLSDLAQVDKVSLDEEAERMLRSAIELRVDRVERVAEFQRIAAMTPKNVTQTDSVVLLREDRDR